MNSKLLTQEQIQEVVDKHLAPFDVFYALVSQPDLLLSIPFRLDIRYSAGGGLCGFNFKFDTLLLSKDEFETMFTENLQCAEHLFTRK